VTGSGGGLNVTSFVTVFVTAYDFSLNVQPGSLTVFQGGSGTSTITVSSLNGLSGFVSLRALLLPPTLGISVSLGTGILFVQNNQTVSTSLTVSASPTAAIGNYTIVLVGSFDTPSGTPVGHALNVTFTIAPKPDFQLIANPPAVSLVQGSSGSSSINATSVNSFVGPISLTSTLSLPGLTVSIANSTIVLSANRTTLTTLMVSAGTNVVGYFTIIVTASGGGIIHSVNIQVYVAPKPDFSLTAFPPSLTVQAGSSALAAVSLTSLNGFTGPVTLSSTAPAGFASNFGLNPILGGSGSSTLSLSILSTVPVGNYTVTVTGTGGSFNHTVAIRVTVSTAAKVTLAVGQVSWSHRVSLRRSGGVETWTTTVRNTGQTPAYFQVLAAGNSTSSGIFFGAKTTVALLAPGASVTITVSQRFTSSSVGLKFNFAVTLYYGSGIYPSGNIISPQQSVVATGAFSVAN
jgi:hypothetical protein